MKTYIITTPRTRSMWLCNITREILATAGHKVVPDAIPVGNPDVMWSWSDYKCQPNEAVCVKTHFPFFNWHNGKVISSLRNPYGTALSYQRFMQCDWTRAVDVIARSMRVMQSVHADPLCLVTSYQAPGHGVVKDIARFLDIQLRPEHIDAILHRHSKRSVQDKINHMTGGVEIQADHTTRLMHPTEGYQTGHINSSHPEEWQDVLTAGQMQEMTNAIRSMS